MCVLYYDRGMINKTIKFAYFGTPQFAAGILDELEKAGFVPSVVVAAPDKPRGRKLVITPPETKVWAQKRNIPVLQPEKLRDTEFQPALKDFGCDIFVVAAYGKLIPKAVIEMPPHGTINVHPSLLPRLRGASPVQSAILSEDETGTTIMMIDEEMDHGAILAQETLNGISWPPKESVLEEALIKQGGHLLALVLPEYIAGNIEPQEQDHSLATFTQKITKEDGLIDPENGDAETNYRKYCAFEKWPRTYFFKDDKRVIITDASFQDGNFVVNKVLPEGGREITWKEFLKK